MTTPAPTGEKKTLGITSLILGIAGLVGLFIPFINFITLAGSVVGIVLGVMSRRREPSAKGLALAGIILSAVALLLGVIFIIIGALAVTAIMNDPTMGQ